MMEMKAMQATDIDLPSITSFLASLDLPMEFNLAEYLEEIRSFGLSTPCQEVYSIIPQFVEMPYALFLICVYIALHSKYDGDDGGGDDNM